VMLLAVVMDRLDDVLARALYQIEAIKRVTEREIRARCATRSKEGRISITCDQIVIASAHRVSEPERRWICKAADTNPAPSF
jgi:hypothetical protein